MSDAPEYCGCDCVQRVLKILAMIRRATTGDSMDPEAQKIARCVEILDGDPLTEPELSMRWAKAVRRQRRCATTKEIVTPVSRIGTGQHVVEEWLPTEKRPTAKDKAFMEKLERTVGET